MGRTSTESKLKYNKKTYKRFVADIKIADYEHIEQLRGEKSRAQFLLMLIEHWEKAQAALPSCSPKGGDAE